MFNEEIWTISQQNLPCFRIVLQNLISYFRIFGQNVYPALEFSGKKYTQENGTSPGTLTKQVPLPGVVVACGGSYDALDLTCKLRSHEYYKRSCHDLVNSSTFH